MSSSGCSEVYARLSVRDAILIVSIKAAFFFVLWNRISEVDHRTAIIDGQLTSIRKQIDLMAAKPVAQVRANDSSEPTASR